RQLWWGHSIPAFYCQKCEHVNVSREDPTACAKCGHTELKPDPDVLDTWFSSGLWPFSTLGWPNQTADLAKFYPTADMETGYDILFFWVARMMMMGIHFMGKPPFKRVLLAGLVTDENGDKMSKVKGNVIDPLDLIHGATLDQLLEKAKFNGTSESGIKNIKKQYPGGFAAYGSDAVRYTLLSYSPQARRIALSVKRIEGYRNFCNKLWNAARYAMLQLDGKHAFASGKRPPAALLINRWILSRLEVAVAAANQGVTDYRLDDASLALYHFVWDELCDWYLELTKPLLSGGDAEAAGETRAVLAHVLETTFRALHPMMPFLTEELWQSLPKQPGQPRACAVANYPQPGVEGLRDEQAEREITWLQAVITSARTIRAANEIAPKVRLSGTIESDSAEKVNFLKSHSQLTASLANADFQVVQLGGAKAAAPSAQGLTVPPTQNEAAVQKSGSRGPVATAVAEGITVVVPLIGLVDLGKEKERLARELAKVEKDLAALRKKHSNAEFIARAPAEVVAKDKERMTELEATQTRLGGALEQLASS
ncbi:MAG TPA: class I tRNA ligase family protein, partial [Polyangiales bacterium]